MKKYSVTVYFKTGLVRTIETDSDVRKLKPGWINGAWFYITVEDIVINIDQTVKMIIR